MAGSRKNRKTSAQSPRPQGSDNKNLKKHGMLFGLTAILTAMLMILVVFGGAFYYVIHKNVNGLADRYRKEIQSIPVLKLALPAPPDPDDPQYLTQDELKDKYNRLREDIVTVRKESAEKGMLIQELQKYKDDYNSMAAELEQAKSNIQQQQTEIDDQNKQLQDDREKFDRLVAANDKEGFKEFYEKMDSTTAQQVYAEVIQELQIDANAKKFAQVYESMEPKAAAKIFEQLGTREMNLIVETLQNMKKEISSEILSEMDSVFASKVTEKLADSLYRQTMDP